jgi:hypothetical protein
MRLYQGAAEAADLGRFNLICHVIQEAILLCTCIQTNQGDNMANPTSSAPKFNPENPLPYGGTTDTHGNIIQAITKEEQDAMLAKVRRAFEKKR